jgi:hypothetical protein
MVTLSVYRARHISSYVKTVAALCSSWLESAEPLRTGMVDWYRGYWATTPYAPRP